MSAGPAEPVALSVAVRKRFVSGFQLQAAVRVPAGITILFGASGSGKTTLLNCIAGLLAPDEGRIVAGQNILFDRDAGVDVPVHSRCVGYVFQSLSLFPHLTVEQNVEYGLRALNPTERCRRSRDILESFRIARLSRRKPAQVSGGERQRVALARSLVTEPRALLLDEPLAALDLPTQSQLIDDLRAWNDVHRIPVLYVTHSQREVFALGERVIVLENGSVLAEGPPHQTLRAPREEAVAELAGVENIFDATVVALHEAQGTMTCHLDGGSLELEIPLGRQQPGSRIRLAIYAGDIILAAERPQGLSARNLVPGKVISLSQLGVAVHVTIDCSPEFLVKITPAARQALNLEVGSVVWLVIKTYSCHLLAARS